MILKYLNKIPAGIMVVPLLLGSLIYTFFPSILEIGSLTTALFSNAGVDTLIGVQLFCLGTTLKIKDMPDILKRGGVLLVSKFVIGAAIGIAFGYFFGLGGILGISALTVISAVTNSNGSVYLALVSEYGDDVDAGAFPFLALNDGPVFTLIALGASGLASIGFTEIIAAVVPMATGMLLGNLDKGLQELFKPVGTALIPLVGFGLGAGINLLDIFRGGLQGILLGLITLFIGGLFVLFFDRKISKRPGYAAWAIATTGGNAVATPAVIASVDSMYEPFVATATVQVGASVVLTAILAPIVTNWWVKKYGSPQFSLKQQAFEEEQFIKGD
ncbi:2-keto-3-deoxygluconate permease [Tetragenococcus halophilus subsp. flandriensis]|uniref:2-keto-3-deoxygluconate permease n=1 Tax=Tetragenococcus halophilus TaxID=51669 RepID=UPI0023E93FCB|nr:2-keto-3-deoxygluconate permease [Tetragenococcus halophilus]GMA09359.1 2-keto-3-deoxygluconate permease [Tetragenococcus halophilus subsp. flandriensis]